MTVLQLGLAGLIMTPHSGKAQTFSGKSNPIKIQIKQPDVQENELKPTITWVYPDYDQEQIDHQQVIVKLGINSQSPLIKITLILNDEILDTFESFSASKPESGYLFDAWIEHSLKLKEGFNDIVLIVQNDQGALRHKRKIEVNAMPVNRTDYALIFGTDEYTSWSNLEGPVRDAERIARELEDRGFKIELVRNATTFDLLEKLEEYARQDFGMGDQLFVYFAGYGQYQEETREGFLVCKNSLMNDDANVTYLSYEVLESIINNIPVPHIFLLLDVVKGKGEPLPLSRNQLSMNSNEHLSGNNMEIGTGRTRIGLISGMEDYRWNNVYSEGSPLSTALISYLRRAKGDRLTWEEFFQEFEKIHPKPLYIEFGDHEPGKGFTFQPPRDP